MAKTKSKKAKRYAKEIRKKIRKNQGKAQAGSYFGKGEPSYREMLKKLWEDDMV